MFRLRSLAWLRTKGMAIVMITALVFMTMLIIEQSRTIENQKSIIRLLYADSLELNTVKLRHALAQKK